MILKDKALAASGKAVGRCDGPYIATLCALGIHCFKEVHFSCKKPKTLMIFTSFLVVA